MIQEARQIDENIFQQIQPYMLAILPRLSFNYLTLTTGLVILWFVGVQLISQFLPLSTANAIMFALELFVFVKGWQFLENRNHATSLFASYMYYSRQRRNLKKLLSDDTDEEALSNNVQWLEEAAEAFIDTAKERGVEPLQDNKS